jgi:peroxiredoxin Q/BCP
MATLQNETERERPREAKKDRLRRERLEREAAARHQAQLARRLRRGIAAAAAVGVVALGGIFVATNSGPSAETGAAEASAGDREQFPYVVGSPGPGEQAPPLNLQSTKGGSFNLAAQRGKRVLLYFQEGIMCQPCWDQLKDLEAQRSKLGPLGIDQMVSVTTDPLGASRQKVAQEGLTSPNLSDQNLAVSSAYTTNQYGMMGTSANGHSFIVVGPDGKIERRLDYGGAPDYTMYLPLPTLLADLRGGGPDGGG